MPCEFVTLLGKLKKSSEESVDNTDTFDPFKKYLHVDRKVEEALRLLLRQINARQSKCLVLVCGSAGDGKSHSVAFFRFDDSENLLAGYKFHNDATESTAPDRTALDTLAEVLAPFNDRNYDNSDETKLIVAINLGTLSNFIESEHGTYFSKLKSYVELNGILSGFVHDGGHFTESPIQHVSFSDYQMFTLTENGVNTAFLEQLIARIFEKDGQNPFYKAYNSPSTCPYSKNCPVRHNYEFLSNSANQKKIIERIVEIIIKDKAIVSTREVLNLIYDLLVHPEFDPGKFFHAVNKTVFLRDYLQYTTPMLLDESGDSEIIRTLQKHDVFKNRSAQLDADVARFHSLESIAETFQNAADQTAYGGIYEEAVELGDRKPDLKTVIYRFIVRLQRFKGVCLHEPSQDRYHEYISYLYYQNSGQSRKLGRLSNAVKSAAMGWRGRFGNDLICIDDTNERYRILEQLNLRSSLQKTVHDIPNEIARFPLVLSLRMKRDGDSALESAEIRIDYALFELISAMTDGYCPTFQDKNHHADFVSFVNQVIEFGSKASRIFIASKTNPSEPLIVFEETECGYEFRVVE